MGNFFTDVIQKSDWYHNPAQCRDMGLLEPRFRAKVEAIIADAAAVGITLCVSETYRSPARQEQLYTQGATQLKSLGTHSFGCACDVYKLVDGKAHWDGDWSFLGRLCVKHGTVWGGDWGMPDKPHSFRDNDHIQAIAVADQAKLFAGTFYPDSTIV